MLTNPFNWRVRWPRLARVPVFSLGLKVARGPCGLSGRLLTHYRQREVRNSIYRYWKIHIDYRSKFLYRFISPISIIYGNTNICRWHRIFSSVYMPSIGDSWPIEEVTKIFFSSSNTPHLIIMMISVVLCKIHEKINYLSIFHNHVVRIWLRNWPANYREIVTKVRTYRCYAWNI